VAWLAAARNKLKSVNLKTAMGLKAALCDCETIQALWMEGLRSS
jgi:hypothetical protein